MNKRRRKVAKNIFVILVLLFSCPPFLQFVWKGITFHDFVLGVLVTVSFFLIVYLVVDAYLTTNDVLFLLFFIALVIWPIINAGVSFFLTAERAKMGTEVKIGGFGDFLSVQYMLDDLVLKAKFVRPALYLMLFTNLSLLVPISLMHRRASHGEQEDTDREKNKNNRVN